MKTGHHYTHSEILLILAFKPSPVNARLLSQILWRTNSAIQWLWRQRSARAVIGEGQSNQIQGQIAAIEKIGLSFLEGKLSIDPVDTGGDHGEPDRVHCAECAGMTTIRHLDCTGCDRPICERCVQWDDSSRDQLVFICAHCRKRGVEL